MTATPLSNLFSPYWLHSQILPQGYHVVVDVDSPAPPLVARPAPTPKIKFRSLAALKRPKLYASPQTQGYAKATVNVTRGVCEVYYKELETATTTPPSPPRTKLHDVGTPPFFPFFQLYLNDQAIYRSRVIHFEPLEDVGMREMTTASGTPATRDRSDTQSPVMSPSLRLNKDLSLQKAYQLAWDEECQFWLYSPNSILTLQLFEKDFCEDLELSRDLLASISVPIATQTPNKALDLVVNVYCTLPEAYSLESLTSIAEQVALSASAKTDKVRNAATASLGGLLDHKQVHPPSALVCRIHLSISLQLTNPRGWRWLAEVAALSLPRGPQTPTSMVQSLTSSDQLSLISGCELLAMPTRDAPVSLYNLSKCVSILAYTLVSGKSVLDNEDVIELITQDHLKFTSEEARKMSYLRMSQDLISIFEHLVIGPYSHFRSRNDNRASLPSHVNRLIFLAILWIGVLYLGKFTPAVILSCMLFCLFLYRHLHIPCKPPHDAAISFNIMDTLGKIQGAQMLIKPLENALLSPQATRRVRLVELWLGTLRKWIVEHPCIGEKSQSPSSLLLQFMRKPCYVIPILITAVFDDLRIATLPLVVFAITTILLRRYIVVVMTRSFLRGVSRYRRLSVIRRLTDLKGFEPKPTTLYHADGLKKTD